MQTEHHLSYGELWSVVEDDTVHGTLTVQTASRVVTVEAGMADEEQTGGWKNIEPCQTSDGRTEYR